jgi:hypothetical protein
MRYLRWIAMPYKQKTTPKGGRTQGVRISSFIMKTSPPEWVELTALLPEEIRLITVSLRQAVASIAHSRCI